MIEKGAVQVRKEEGRVYRREIREDAFIKRYQIPDEK